MNSEKNDEESKDKNNEVNKVEVSTGNQMENSKEILNELEKPKVERNITVTSTTVTRNSCVPIKSRSLPSTDSCLVIDVAFEARPPSDSDVCGIKKLLQQLFVQYEYEDVSELSNLVVAQDFVGCVLKQDYNDSESEDSSDDDDDDNEDDDVFAVSTVINISENQNLSCIKKICDLLVTKCDENYKDEPSRMANLIGDPSEQIGLLISERFINIPPQVSLPSYQSLKLDIENAVLKNKTFDFTHLVLISKQYRGKIDEQREDELFYCNPEEQLFKEMSEFSYTFSVAGKKDVPSEESDGSRNEEDSDFESLRTVMVFGANALSQMIIKLQANLSST